MLTVVHLIEDVPREFDTAAFEIDDNGTLIILDHPAGLGGAATPRVVAAFAAGSWGAVVPKEP